MIEWIADGWGITRDRGYWWVVFGDLTECVYSGHYPTRRRAKKEITHYIDKGLARGPFHGAYAHLNKLSTGVKI